MRGALLGGGEPAAVNHASFQPPHDLISRGKRAELADEMVMVDPVERRRQFRIKDPYPLGPWALAGGIDRLDRIMAATAWSEPIGSRLEPCLPLRFQRMERDRLQRAVSDHWYPEALTGDGHLRPLLGRAERADREDELRRRVQAAVDNGEPVTGETVGQWLGLSARTGRRRLATLLTTDPDLASTVSVSQDEHR